MVVHVNPSPSFDIWDQDRMLADRSFLEAAVLDPAGPERTILNDLIRTRGIAAIGSHALRRNARHVIGHCGPTLSEASRVLLARLAIGGYQQPDHREYTAVSVLCRTDDAIARAAPETVARIALRTVADMLDFMVDLPQLANHPDHARLKERVASSREMCGSLAFAPAQSDGFGFEEPDEDPVAHGAMLPESGVPDELIFQTVTQASEVVFAAARILASRAVIHITHDQAVLAATALHYAALVERPLINLLGLLVAMEVSTWLEIRPFIERPGAIQSENYRELRKTYGELERIAHHPRYPKHEEVRIHWLRESLDEAVGLFERWQSMHRAIVLKYTPGGSAGTQWLEQQVRPISEKRRGAGSGQAATQKNKPLSGGCPMGHGTSTESSAAAAPIGY